MHRIIEDGLEDYLSGKVLRDFEVHLAQCVECRVELQEIGSVSTLFREAFAAPEALEPPPGFYARLSENLESRKAASPWAFFSIDAVFGRRMAFASLLALAIAGGFLISRETDSTIETSVPEAVMAQHDAERHDVVLDRDRMMVTLASYEH